MDGAGQPQFQRRNDTASCVVYGICGRLGLFQVSLRTDNRDGSGCMSQRCHRNARPMRVRCGPKLAGEYTVLAVEVLALIGKGHSLGDIARLLNRSIKTIDSHRSAVSRKLRVSERTTLSRVALRAGLRLSDARICRLRIVQRCRSNSNGQFDGPMGTSCRGARCPNFALSWEECPWLRTSATSARPAIGLGEPALPVHLLPKPGQEL